MGDVEMGEFFVVEIDACPDGKWSSIYGRPHKFNILPKDLIDIEGECVNVVSVGTFFPGEILSDGITTKVVFYGGSVDKIKENSFLEFLPYPHPDSYRYGNLLSCS